MSMIERLIVALDVPEVAQAEALVEDLGDSVGCYKIGYQLMPIGGLDLALKLLARGKRVFFDFKFHDIAATVERGVASIVKLGGDFLTVHAEPDVLKGAVAGRGDDPRLKILAVTVLTSLDQAALNRSGYHMTPLDLVLKRAAFAVEAGVDGVIASAQEAAEIRARFGNELLIVTPGIRPASTAANDQKRVATPVEAVRAGADYLVIGRPIIAVSDPKKAANAITFEMNKANFASQRVFD